MALQAISTRNPSDQTGFSTLEKTVLRRVHPKSILLDVVGITWFTYFLWNHEVVLAIATVITSRALAFLAVAKPNYSALAQTVWGKLGLLHLHPANLLVQTAGAAITVAGLWTHSTLAILAGISVIVLGHWFGWEKVHSAL